MIQAANMNGLAGSDVKPWHLRATFTLFDGNGNVIDHGTYEEFWASPTKFKSTFAGLAFNQTNYGSNKGTLRSGTHELPSELVADLRREFVNPLPELRSMEYLPFELLQREAGAARLSCVSLRGFNLPAYLFGTSWCLDSDKPVLQISISTQESIQVIHSKFLNFQDRVIAGDLQFVRDGKAILTSHLESAEPLPAINDADFNPSANATLLPRRVAISSGVTTGFLLKHDRPAYPRGATESGTVVLRILIDESGRVIDVHFAGGPLVFKDSALEAASKWKYKPYLINGEPVQVDTTANLVFSR